MTATSTRQRRWRIQASLLVGVMAALAVGIWWTTRSEIPPANLPKTPPKLLTLDHLDPAAIPVEHRFTEAPRELVAVLGDPRGRHDRAVRCVTYSPDGKRLASGGEDGVVRLWNADTLHELQALPTEQLLVSHVTFSEDGKLLAAACSNHPVDESITVRLWEVTGARAQLVAALPGHHGGRGACLAFAKTGTRLAVCAPKGRVRWWDVSARPPKLLEELVHDDNPIPEGNCLAVACTPDGKTLLTAGDSRNGKPALRLWDLTTQPPQARVNIPSQPALAADLSFDAAGNTLLVRFQWPEQMDWVELRQRDGERITDLGTADLSKFKSPLYAQALSPDGRTVALAGNQVYLFDVVKRTFRPQPLPQHHRAYALAFSPDGKRLAVGDGDGQVRIWKWEEDSLGQPVTRLTSANRVTFRPDGRTLAVSHADESKVRLWDLQPSQPQILSEIPGVDPRAVAFAPNANTLVIGDTTLGLRLWDLNAKEPQEKLSLSLGGPETSTSLVLAPGGQRALRLFQPKSKEFRQTLVFWDVRDLTAGPKSQLELSHLVSLVALNEVLVAGVVAKDTGDFEVRLWEPNQEGFPKRSVLPFAEAVTALALRADGQGVACASADGQTTLWDVSGSQPVEKVRLEGKMRGVGTLAFAPNEKTLAGAAGEQVVLWDTVTGKRLHTWSFTTRIHHLAFAPDGRHLATANANGTVFILRLPQ